MNSARHGLVVPIVTAALSIASGRLAAFAATSHTPGALSRTSAVSLSPLHLAAPVPPGWVSQPPATSMRLAQFQAPGEPGSEDAEVIFFYFGQGQGGPVDANIGRWQSQFTSPDGKPVNPLVQRLKVSGMPVTTMELTGAYTRGVGMGPAGPSKVD